MNLSLISRLAILINSFKNILAVKIWTKEITREGPHLQLIFKKGTINQKKKLNTMNSTLEATKLTTTQLHSMNKTY